MNKLNLSQTLTSEFSATQIIALAKALQTSRVSLFTNQVFTQRALLGNLEFLPYLQDLLDAKIDPGHIESLLKYMSQRGESLLDFPSACVVRIMTLYKTSTVQTYSYFLRHFSDQTLSDETATVTLSNLDQILKENTNNISTIIERDKQLLTQAYPNFHSFARHATLGALMRCFAENPQLQPLALFLFEGGITAGLKIDEWQSIANSAGAATDKCRHIFDMLGRDATRMSSLFKLWFGNGAVADELDHVIRRLDSPDVDVKDCFANRSAYINMLYGSKIKGIPFNSLVNHQENLLIYAINKKKHAFLRLVQENLQQFLAIGAESILYRNSQFYTDYLNLNEINVNQLKAMAGMTKGWALTTLPKRLYTFNEIAAVYGLNRQYAVLYGMLPIDSVDKRLQVIREVAKQRALEDEVSPDGLISLAQKLNERPLSEWITTHFNHISGIDATGVVQLLSVYDRAEPFIRDLKTSNDVTLVKRNAAHLAEVATLDQLKARIISFDPSWLKLKEHLGISDAFVQNHHDKVVDFICKEGAHIALKYYESLDKQSQYEAIRRIVKAELMDAFDKLKYHAGDLEQEIEYKLDRSVAVKWRKNIDVSSRSFYVKECDDFYSTMRLGATPQKTCLHYEDGLQNECLLSCFDSNKKVVYIWEHGKVVGRALIRLTKGQHGKRNIAEKGESTLMFPDLESPGGSQQITRESLVLFLERPYQAHLSPDMEQKAIELLIRLAEQKAQQLGCLLVLSMEYKRFVKPSDFTLSNFSLFISKSKGGAQYHDSLSGAAYVKDEGSYKANSFLVSTKMPR